MNQQVVSRSQLKFHETFQPEFGYIARLLKLSAVDFKGDKFEISDKTGIPTGKQKGKVEPHIKYASFMNLITYDVERGVYNLSLTELGRSVFEQDPFLQEALSRWICHFELSRLITGAPQWRFLINDGHPGFIEGISFERLLEQANSFFGLSLSFEELLGVVKRSYLDGMFSGLEIMRCDSDNNRLFFEEKSVNDELLYVYAYALLKNWDSLFPKQHELSLPEVIDELSIGKIFGFNDESIGELLDELADEGIVSLNRQLFPTTILRHKEVSSLVNQLYDRLM